ncbi:Sugar transporter STL1 [Colletotrichum sp. SAR11_57]|nr:Sugar transporter STL1 [Colletotrichum sp. SAR11_57]
MSGIIGAENRFARDFNNPDPDMQGNITSLYNIGCVVGSIISYFIGERLGRRSMLMSGATIMIIGSILLGASENLATLLAGCIITGIGNGMNSSTAPVYLSECAPASIRGALLTLQGTVTILGVVIAYWTDYGTSFYEYSFQWRFPLAFQAFFAVFIVLQIVGLPETPRWLVARDRYEEGRDVIAAILDKPLDDEAVERVLLDIQSGLEEEKRDGPFRFRELFSWGSQQNLRRLILTISVQLGQQFSGSNMINYYLPGPSTMFCSNHGFVMVTILLTRGSSGAASGAVAFIFLFQLFYGVGWLPYLKRTDENLQANIEWRTFIIFAVLNILFIPMVYFFYPETKGLELEDIPLLFTKGGVTGGVYSTGGRTVQPGQHALEAGVDSKQGNIQLDQLEEVRA